jgi:hypothetical protein
MQEQIRTDIRAPENGRRIEIKIRFLQSQGPEGIQVKPAVAPVRGSSFFQNLTLPERGEAFSPLND